MEQDELERDIKRSSVIVKTLIVVIPIMYFAWFFIFKSQPISEFSSDWGTFGDFFGGVLNPAIAFFAFYWLTKSVLIQKEELAATKNALMAANEGQNKQELLLRSQKFEGTFFSLLDQHNIVLNNILDPGGQGVQSEVISIAKRKIFRLQPESLESAKERALDINYLIGNYFRILYQILKYVYINIEYEKREFNDVNIINLPVLLEEKMYTNIVRSFITQELTQILAVNCYSKGEDDIYYKYRLLIERYQFLEHMPFIVREQKEHPVLLECLDHYDRKVFGNNVMMPSER